MVEKKNWFQRMRMPLPELEAYYQEQRRIDHENQKPFTAVRLRKMLHPVLLLALRVMHLFTGQRVRVLTDQRKKTGRPILYAATHIGWDDIEMIFTAITDHAYLFWGDPRESYQTLDGVLLGLNGVICCHTGDKTDRYIGKETCTRWLQQGGNLLIFPEGIWNTTEAKPVMGLYSGAAEMAIRSGAELVPIAISQYGKTFHVSIGRNIPAEPYPLKNKQALTDRLRDELATLKWHNYDHGPRITRESLPLDARKEYQLNLLWQAQGIYTWDELRALAFRPKGVCSPEEAFAHLETLIPCRENGFLLRQNVRRP